MILTADQQQLLDALKSERFLTETFYLSGGTALAEYYLHHRLSEDLDFFSEEEIDVEALSALIKKISAVARITEVTYEQSFNRNLFFLTMPHSSVKTEFTYYPFPRIEEGKRDGALAIDSLLDIAVNKVFTISQKPRARDFIDLYCILQEKPQWSLEELIAKAKVKFDHHIDPLQMSAQCAKAEAIGDLPTMKVALEENEWRTYFLNAARQLARGAIT